MSDPYLAARQEWDERYGSYVSSARSWRLFALLLVLVLGIAVAGLIYLASQSRLVPYVVVIDDIGNPVVTQAIKPGVKVSPRVVRAELSSFITDMRSVITDGTAQRAMVDRVYAHLAGGDSATNVVSNFYRNNQPFERATLITVEADIKVVTPMGGDTWRVEWEEVEKSRSGETLGTEQYQSVITVRFVTYGDFDDEVQKNPIGLFVKELRWSKRMK